jgi:bifunctional ADP-heptose synthase (sugar kinase/adenylyltransferase)
VYVKGADYGPGGKPLPEAALAASLGTRVELIDLVPGHSTTALVHAIRRGQS